MTDKLLHQGTCGVFDGGVCTCDNFTGLERFGAPVLNPPPDPRSGPVRFQAVYFCHACCIMAEIELPEPADGEPRATAPNKLYATCPRCGGTEWRRVKWG